MTPEKISRIDTVDGCRALIANAERLGNREVRDLAFRRLCQISGLGENPGLAREFAEVLAAYEELLSEKNGRRTTASRTRMKLKNKGLHQCLVDWTLATDTSSGFDILVERGLGELTGEFLVVKYANEFDDYIVDAARHRLTAHGISLPD